MSHGPGCPTPHDRCTCERDDPYEMFQRERQDHSRSADWLAMANINYLVRTGRMEEMDSYEDLLHSSLSTFRLERECRRALREDGHHYLDSRLGIWSA
jgi:hypothetical protein